VWPTGQLIGASPNRVTACECRASQVLALPVVAALALNARGAVGILGNLGGPFSAGTASKFRPAALGQPGHASTIATTVRRVGSGSFHQASSFSSGPHISRVNSMRRHTESPTERACQREAQKLRTEPPDLSGTGVSKRVVS